MDIVARILEDRPTFHSGGTARWDCLPDTLRVIARSTQPGDRTVETGCGASTVVFAAAGAVHTSISPDPGEHQRVVDYCRSIGVDTSDLDFVAGFSDAVLPPLCTDRTFDVAFIDGAHVFPMPMIDWHYTSRALNVGGRMIIDDIPVPAVLPLFRNMQADPSWALDEVLDNRAATFRLVCDPPTVEWEHQPFNRHYPDYSFAPLSERLRLTAGVALRRARRAAGRRLPGARTAPGQVGAESVG